MPTTKNHELIKTWAQEHGAVPSIVDDTGGLLRFDFDLNDQDALEHVNWDRFFEIFDSRGIELLYDEDPNSRFHKFVYPENAKGS